MSDPVETEILRVGAQGDGIADGVDGPIFVPQGLPGERWRLIDGRAAKRLSSSPSRQQPVCAHFSECGGCSAQHMATDFYSDWKVEALRTAFAHRGIDTTPEPMRRVGAHTRRRATFSFARVDGKCAFGFHRGGDKALVDVFECPVLAPAIIEALPDLRAVAATLASVRSRSEKCEGRMVVTALDHGLDIAITYGRLNLAPAMRTELSERALAAKALSLQINGDLIVQTQAPVLTVNGAQLEALSGVFLQAVSEVEQTIADLCIHATKKAKKVADLFSGIGTFTFPLARSARVYAFDSDVAAINSLSNSVKRNQGYKPIIAQHRDLFRDPLSPRELREFDAVVLNPPRAGAAEQSERLARSTVGTVAMIACNPATLARDARYLIDGGYMLRALTPIDQFLYSGHLEAVAVFQRSDASARRRAT